MSLPEGRAAPEELFETFPEASPEEVMALADTESEPASDEVGTEAFDRFVDGVSVEREDRPTRTGDEERVDMDELFG